MGLSARSFASLENMSAPNVSTRQTNMVLKKEMMALVCSSELVLMTPKISISSGMEVRL